MTTSTQQMFAKRTHYEAVLDVRYGQRFNELCERFYNRIDMLFGLAGFLGGSAAVVSLLNQVPLVAAWAGVCLAGVSTLERLIGASRKAEQHAVARKAFGELDAQSATLGLEEIDARLRLMQASFPSGIRLLAVPAFNANLASAGRAEFALPVTRLQRFAAFFA